LGLKLPLHFAPPLQQRLIIAAQLSAAVQAMFVVTALVSNDVPQD
jgi:hypothetical protein